MPHMATASSDVERPKRSASGFAWPSSTTSAVARGRMCRGEHRSRRQRAPGAREEDRFATPEIVEHRGDAVGPLL